VTAYIAAIVVGGVAGFAAGTTERVGHISEITLSGEPTGVHRLSVGPDAVFASRKIDAGYLPAETADQRDAEMTAWAAACLAWGDVDVLGADQTASCAVSSDRPTVGYPEKHEGTSAGLANAVAFLDWHYDVVGDLEVAATGEVWNTTIVNPDSGVSTTEAAVFPIGGAPEKAAAAAAADVDVLLVPFDQRDEFAASPELRAAGVEVVGVRNVASALHELCARSLTEVCVQRVLVTE
jgi:predicted S18 family serine protease